MCSCSEPGEKCSFSIVELLTTGVCHSVGSWEQDSRGQAEKGYPKSSCSISEVCIYYLLIISPFFFCCGYTDRGGLCFTSGLPQKWVKCWATWIQVAPFPHLRKWRKKVLPWFNLFFWLSLSLMFYIYGDITFFLAWLVFCHWFWFRAETCSNTLCRT